MKRELAARLDRAHVQPGATARPSGYGTPVAFPLGAGIKPPNWPPPMGRGQDGISNEAEPEVADVVRGSGTTPGEATAGGTFVHRTESGEPVVLEPDEEDRDRAD